MLLSRKYPIIDVNAHLAWNVCAPLSARDSHKYVHRDGPIWVQDFYPHPHHKPPTPHTPITLLQQSFNPLLTFFVYKATPHPP